MNELTLSEVNALWRDALSRKRDKVEPADIPPSPETESPPFDPARIAHELELRAKRGDQAAIREILFAARVFAHSLSYLAQYEETKSSLAGVASAELTWPAVVSRHGKIVGNSADTASYLDAIGLGSSFNLNRDAPDARTKDRLAAVMFFLNVIRERGNVDPLRNGLSCQEWLASDNGKRVLEEIAVICDELGIARHRFPTFEPLIRRAMSRKGKDGSKAFGIAIAKQIHGMLQD